MPSGLGYERVEDDNDSEISDSEEPMEPPGTDERPVGSSVGREYFGAGPRASWTGQLSPLPPLVRSLSGALGLGLVGRHGLPVEEGDGQVVAV